MTDADDDTPGQKGGGNPTQWMLTFADLLSLILTFFVMFYAMQQVENAKWQKMVGSLSSRLNPERGGGVTTQPAPNPSKVQQVEELIAINLDYLQAVLNDKFGDIPEFSKNRVRRFDDRLTISFSADKVFSAGGLSISETTREEIAKLSTILGTVGNRIDIISYVDKNVPTNDQSAWKYTMKRASAIADEFKRSGYTNSITAFGVGDSRNNIKADAAKVPAQNVALAPAVDPSRIDIVVREMSATE